MQAAINIERLPTATTDMLEEVIIEDAIECGAEDVNVQDANTGLITVRHKSTIAAYRE